MILLADAEDALTLFTEGIAGRYLHIKASAEFLSPRLDLDHGDASLGSDTVYVPDALDYDDSAAFRVLVLEQLGYREFGSYRFSLATARARIPALAALPEPRQTLRESDFALFYRHVEHPGMLRHVHAATERARVLACLGERYPGMARHQRRFARHQQHARAASQVQVPLLDAILNALQLSAEGLDDLLPASVRRLRIWPDLESSMRRAASAPGPYDAAECALEIYAALTGILDISEVDGSTAEVRAEVQDWLQREERLEDWQEALTEMDGRLAAELEPGTELEAESSEDLEAGELRQADVDIRALKNERDTLARKLEMEKSAIRDALGTARPLARSYRYDEWDHTARRYLRHYCRLYEEPLPRVGEADLDGLKRIIRQHAPGVQKRFEQIKPLGFQRVKRVPDGDELDLNAIIEARQDLRAGRSPDERVYSRRERVHRDVCAAFLVDLSASTDDPIDTPEPPPPNATDASVNLRDPYDDPLNLEVDVSDEPRRRIIDVQRESMLVMATALEQLGDSYGIYGFSGYGRDCVEFFVAKEPDAAFTAATLEAIAGMSPKRSTRMGPAIRHATMKLNASGHALKLLIILSDGFPQDCDYGPTRGDHRYGLLDTAKALEEAHNKGVETFCVTVDRSGHDYLKEMCPDARYLVIDEIEDLPEALSKVYQALAGR